MPIPRGQPASATAPALRTPAAGAGIWPDKVRRRAVADRSAQLIQMLTTARGGATYTAAPSPREVGR